MYPFSSSNVIRQFAETETLHSSLRSPKSL